MRAILRQSLFLIFALIVLYALFWSISYVIMPAHSTHGGLDSDRAGDSLFMTEPKYVFLNRASLMRDVPRVVFAGASNLVVGFRQDQVQALMPGVEVDNLSVGGSNLTEVAQIVSLVQQMQGEEARRHTTFVIGIWYGMFVPNRFRWDTPDRHPGDTDLDIERYRYGFYRRGPNGPQAVLPPHELAFGVALIHPYLVLDRLSRMGTQWIRDRLFGKPPERTDAERNATVMSVADRRMAMDYWRGQMHSDGPLEAEQFDVLERLADRILASGSHLVLVDMPIPHWHEVESPYYRYYVERERPILSHLAHRPGFTYFDMKDHDNDLDFSDEIHPKPRVAPEWAQLIATELHGAIHDPGPEVVANRRTPSDEEGKNHGS